MPGPFGVTPQGFVVKPIDQILADIEAVQLAKISPTLDVQPTAIMGVMNGQVAAEVSEIWELAAALYNGMDPDNATSDQLASLSLITGTKRQNATTTVVTGCVVNVAAGFHAAPGFMVARMVGNDVNLFTNLDPVDNPGGTAANVTVDFACLDAGPILAPAGTLTVKAVPLAGWNTITNPIDGLPGKPIETDADLRVQRNIELELAGNSTADAIEADVFGKMQPPTTTVQTTSVRCLFNDTDATDSNGVPPHSVEVIARAPGATADDDTALANLILKSKSAGTGTSGTTSKVVKDSQRNETVISFTRPADTDIYIDVTVVTDPETFPPTGGAALIQAALVAYGNNTYQPGTDVFSKKLADQVFTVPGVVDWTVFNIGTAPSPSSGANIPIDIRHVAVLSTSRINVTVT